MTVRIAKLSDAPGLMKLWNDAVDGNYFDFWTVASGQHIGHWTLKKTEAQIDSSQWVYVDVVKKEVIGFFLGYPNILPGVIARGTKADRLVLWLVKVGVSSEVFDTSLRRLFNFWFKDAYSRGYEWVWGTIPPNSPPGGVAFVRAANLQGIMEAKDPENGWLIFYAHLPMPVLTPTP